jgi:hypothetical protein
MRHDRKPTERQQTLIRLATRKRGATRADVRAALNYDAGENVPVQIILKTVAARFDYRMVTDDGVNKETGRKIAVYRFERKQKRA